jgi:hypothetical protein
MQLFQSEQCKRHFYHRSRIEIKVRIIIEIIIPEARPVSAVPVNLRVDHLAPVFYRIFKN